MGITKLNEFIREKAKVAGIEIYKTKPLTFLSGHRLAIDAGIWMFRHMSVLQRDYNITLSEEENRLNMVKKWLIKSVEDCIHYLDNDIIPVFVFDGAPPVLKEKTRNERSQKKIEVRAKLKELREKMKDGDMLTNANLLLEYRKLAIRDTHISREEVELLKGLLHNLGIPYLQAKGEAEKLCSMLVIEGTAIATLSNDTDNLAYGCPCLVTSIDRESITIINANEVMDLLGLPYLSFVDFCIMLGCDYNKNISNIGPVKSYQLIKKYGSLQRLLSEPSFSGKHDTSVLNYEACKELFSYKHSSSLTEYGYLNIQKDHPFSGNAHQFLQELGLVTALHRIITLYNKVQPPAKLPFRFPTNGVTFEIEE